MAGVPTSNILQPGAVSLSNQNRQLMVDLQILAPQFYRKYVEKYGNEDFTWWLASHAGMEEVKNQNFFWFENRGKLMSAVTNTAAVNAPAAGATVTITIGSADCFNSGTQSPLRVGETLRIASNNVEGKILTINKAVANAHTATVRPLKSTQAFAGPTGNLEVGEILKFGGDTEAGEASTQIDPLIHLDQQYDNNITEIREGWSNTDLAQMADTYYEYPVSGELAANGVRPFTYKGMHKTLVRFKNNVESKLMIGDSQTNTGLNTSVGSQGVIPKVVADGETIGYTPGNLDIAKFHEITRVMDVNGCDKQVAWLADIFQRQDFSDGLFAQFPAGSFVWGQGEKSEDAAVAYGFQKLYIDEYMFQIKKYPQFNTEYTTGKTPTIDYFRNFGLLYPMGKTQDSRTGSSYANLSIMYQQPPVGGTIGNAIRLWQYGGGSPNPTDGTMTNQIAIMTYRGTRLCSANKWLIVQAQ
jgi:hypothetical protein